MSKTFGKVLIEKVLFESYKDEVDAVKKELLNKLQENINKYTNIVNLEYFSLDEATKMLEISMRLSNKIQTDFINLTVEDFNELPEISTVYRKFIRDLKFNK